MIRKTIVRAIERTTIQAYKAEKVDGKPQFVELEAVTVFGKVNDKEAQRAVVAAHGKGAMAGDFESVSESYEISVEDFIAAATKIEQEQN